MSNQKPKQHLHSKTQPQLMPKSSQWRSVNPFLRFVKHHNPNRKKPVIEQWMRIGIMCLLTHIPTLIIQAARHNIAYMPLAAKPPVGQNLQRKNLKDIKMSLKRKDNAKTPTTSSRINKPRRETHVYTKQAKQSFRTVGF